MILLNGFLEVIFYLGVTLIVELLVLIGLGYIDTKLIKTVLLINVVTNPFFTILLLVYSNVYDQQMGILLLLLFEVVIVLVELYIVYRCFKSKYLRIELIMIVFFINGFSFLVAEFLRYLLDYLKFFPII